MVTAETATVLPVLALLLSFGLWAVSAASAQVRCSDAAREAARAAARGEPDLVVRSDALRAAPVGARVSVVENAASITVVVTARAGPLGHRLPSITVTGRAVAAREPSDVG
jgi:TadE-like protein